MRRRWQETEGLLNALQNDTPNELLLVHVDAHAKLGIRALLRLLSLASPRSGMLLNEAPAQGSS